MSVSTALVSGLVSCGLDYLLFVLLIREPLVFL